MHAAGRQLLCIKIIKAAEILTSAHLLGAKVKQDILLVCKEDMNYSVG